MKEQIQKIYETPLLQLVNLASAIHNRHHPGHKIQASSLMSIKTGGCPENCSYCAQSAHYKTDLQKMKLTSRSDVLNAARSARNFGANRFCMGAAWREIRDGDDFEHVLNLVRAVSELGLETCCTLGMLTSPQAERLKEAGLNYYNHNIDTSPEHYHNIVQTRKFQDRLDTLERVRNAGIKICTGGILGLGESDKDRISFIDQLVSMNPQPESITVNLLVPIKGTPSVESANPVDFSTLLRVICTIRILAPQSMIRLSAGRESLSQEVQFLCFLSGANSIFLGEKLLTSPNFKVTDDFKMLEKFGMKVQEST